MAAAQTLADVAAAYLINAQARVDLKESSERARVSSLHDALTGLPNRTLLVQRLDHAVLRSRRSEKMVAILFADLDQFKAVNDTYGHHVGDELLIAVAERLTGLIRPGDTLARLQGDEFVILCEDLDDVSQVELLAVRIDTALAAPFTLSGTEVKVSASVGMAFAGLGEDISEQVLQDADAAMYQAKRDGGGRHTILDLREQRRADDRDRLKRELQGALRRGELYAEYQPIVATIGGQITGVEALLRWTHPNRGLVDPETVVALAEQSGQIADIGQWMLRRACLDLRRWMRHHRGGLDISVNVSARQLMTAGFVAMVAEVLRDTHTDPVLVTLEVTESVFIQDSDRALVVLNELKRAGVRLALDDFGTGYSALSYLKDFPVDVVKIDRAFIADLGRDPASRLIVGAVVQLAHSLRLGVVAEGVETAEHFAEMTQLECESYQGYYFARPMSADKIDALLLGAAVA
jgi:diguanylate cyclase (GGDEF)-like protein